MTAAEAALDRIRSIHSPVDAVMYANGREYPRQVCAGCDTDDGNWQVWPCPTIRAMRPHPDGELRRPVEAVDRREAADLGEPEAGERVGAD